MMPTKSPTVRVQVSTTGRERRTFELTTAQVRALTTVSRAGKMSDVVPFETARSLAKKGLFNQQGPHWFITKLGSQVGRKAYAKTRG